MARNISGVYSLPAGSIVASGDTILPAQHNTPLNDIASDLNLPRPVVAGGTGADNAPDALVNLGVTATAAEINTALDGATFTAEAANRVGQFTGRNLIINGSGRVNQRGYVSGAATSGANQFTLDRWFVITSGQSLTFTGDASARVMTAPAGGVSTVIEGANIVGGTYVLNWTGTATATVGGVARTKGETFTLTANANVTVTFASGTFSDVQLEAGSVVTPFERRSLAQERALCQEYYLRSAARWRFEGIYGGGGGTTYAMPVYFPTMRAAPTMTTITSGQTEATSPTWSDTHPNGALATWQWTNTAIVVARIQVITFAADAEITS